MCTGSCVYTGVFVICVCLCSRVRLRLLPHVSFLEDNCMNMLSFVCIGGARCNVLFSLSGELPCLRPCT